jgi:hypothetical protein
VANGSLGSPVADVTNSSTGAVKPGAAAAGGDDDQAAEAAGNKAIQGMRSAAVDFFKGMDWKDLWGSGRASAAP